MDIVLFICFCVAVVVGVTAYDKANGITRSPSNEPCSLIMVGTTAMPDCKQIVCRTDERTRVATCIKE